MTKWYVTWQLQGNWRMDSSWLPNKVSLSDGSWNQHFFLSPKKCDILIGRYPWKPLEFQGLISSPPHYPSASCHTLKPLKHKCLCDLTEHAAWRANHTKDWTQKVVWFRPTRQNIWMFTLPYDVCPHRKVPKFPTEKWKSCQTKDVRGNVWLITHFRATPVYNKSF